MPNFKEHTKLNIHFLKILIFLVILASIGTRDINPLFFCIGFLIATYVIHPDLDLAENVNRNLWDDFWYVYGIVFSHRGISHDYLFGTITRIAYVGIPIVLGTLIVEINIINVITKYQKLFEWLIFGMYSADIIHYLADGHSTKTKIFKRILNK